jgi:hypothetical protein
VQDGEEPTRARNGWILTYQKPKNIKLKIRKLFPSIQVLGHLKALRRKNLLHPNL